MTQEQLKELGLSEADAKRVETASLEELKAYVPKTRFDEVNNAKKQLDETIKEHQEQLNTLKASASNDEQLKKQIEELQEINIAKEAELQEELKKERLSTAIKLAIADSAQDSDLVAGLVDRNKLILDDSGKVTGLDEQLKSLRESKSFLFKEDKTETKKPALGIKVGASQEQQTQQEVKPMSLREAVAAKLSEGQ